MAGPVGLIFKSNGMKLNFLISIAFFHGASRWASCEQPLFRRRRLAAALSVPTACMILNLGIIQPPVSRATQPSARRG